MNEDMTGLDFIHPSFKVPLNEWHALRIENIASARSGRKHRRRISAFEKASCLLSVSYYEKNVWLRPVNWFLWPH